MRYTSFPRGSEWRKWDLHLHSPMSGLANKFPTNNGMPDWEQYLQRLEALADIPAIGVADYFLIEGYKKLKEFKQRGRLEKIELILPNIEFRLDTVVGARRINFHVIFSDEVSSQDIEDHFLSNIDIAIEGSPRERADIRKLRRSSLEELGARRKSEHAPFRNRSDFEIGCMTAVASLDQIMDILTTNSLFKDKYLTALAEENTSLMDWNGQDHGVRKLMLQHSHILFSANPSTISWCLGKKHPHPKDFVQEFKTLKPCAIGSDAHDLATIGAPPNGKFTWIKADVTFNGLKQIIYEPEDRIFIGSTPPDEKDNTKVITALRIKDANGWFADQTIELNRDMVAIIGGKGSGKTALVDLLAYAGGHLDFENQEAFLRKAEEEISGTKLCLTWEDGTVGPWCEVYDEATRPDESKVRYLSQSFIEQLCSFDQHEKLVRQIENILFQYVPNDMKLGAKDFENLKEIKTRPLQLEIEKIATSLQKLNKDIFNLEIELAGKDALQKDRERLVKERADLESQRPPAANEEEQKEQEQLQHLREKKAAIEKTIEAHRIQISQLEEFRTRASLLKTEVEEFNADIKKHLATWGLEDQAADLIFTVPAQIDIILRGKISQVETSIENLEGREPREECLPSAPLAAATLVSTAKQITDIEAKSKLEAQRKRKLIEFSNRVAEITTRIATADKTIEALETTKRQLLDQKVKERDSHYLAFFEKLDRKKSVLEQLYKPLNEPVGSSGERGKVEFYARFNFNIRRFVSQGINLFDGRKSVVRGEAGLNEVAQEFWKQVKKLLPNMNQEPMLNLLSGLQKTTGGTRQIKAQLKSEFSQADVYDWLYCVDYFDVEYGIKHENVDLDKLSKGRKGVVLLLIYLDVDRDFRPLVLDQPEENLDNRSVYSTLVEYFRKAKKKRQIILVTHNANLVVNCDAEQVIVANFDLEKQAQRNIIEYVCGSLEFKKGRDHSMASVLHTQGIREHVCEILEGGEEAFQRREHKYGL
ncbi:MAG: TrlF family AAA-like ATPase [Verrucomicrobiota bacterium]